MSMPRWEGVVGGEPTRLDVDKAGMVHVTSQDKRGAWQRIEGSPAAYVLGEVVKQLLTERLAVECAGDTCDVPHLPEGQFCEDHTCAMPKCFNGSPLEQPWCPSCSTSPDAVHS